MAVARINLTKRQFQAAAKRVKPHVRPGLADERGRLCRGMHKELTAAADRPGLLAELCPKELDILAELTADWPAVNTVVQAAQRQAADVEVHDARRVQRVRAMMDAHRGVPTGGGVA